MPQHIIMLLPPFLASRTRLFVLTTSIVLISLLLLHSSSPSSFSSTLSPFSSSTRPFPTFDEDYRYDGESHHAAANQTRAKRIAVIGAGASGSSAAWFIKRAGRIVEERLGKREGEVLGEIVIYDMEERIGGSESNAALFIPSSLPTYDPKSFRWWSFKPLWNAANSQSQERQWFTHMTIILSGL